MKSQAIYSAFSSMASADEAAQTTSTTAPAAGLPAGAPPQPSPIMSFVPMLLMIGVVYFMIIRPQQKKMKDHQEQVNKLQPGDEVVTQGGIFGTISQITDKIVTLEVDKNVKLRVLKSQVASVVKGGEVS